MDTTFFIPTLSGGGAERVVVSLANALSKDGAGVGVLLFERKGVFIDSLSKRVRLDDLGVSNRLSRLLGIREYVRYVKKHRLNCFVVSGHSAFLVSFLGILLVPHKLIVVVHNAVSSEVGVSKLIAKFFYRYADRVITVSKGVYEDIRKYGKIDPAKMITIYNPVEIDQIERMAQEDPIHRWLENSDLKVLIAAGSLSKQKNFSLLIRAIAKVKITEPKIRLIILGEGPLKLSLDRLIKVLDLTNEVELAGFVSNPYSYMAKSARFVLSSDYEGFCLVLVEALASGAKVISTDCHHGPSETLEDGRWGTLVPPGDVEALANAILLPDDHFPSVQESKLRARLYTLERAVGLYREVIST